VLHTYRLKAYTHLHVGIYTLTCTTVQQTVRLKDNSYLQQYFDVYGVTAERSHASYIKGELNPENNMA